MAVTSCDKPKRFSRATHIVKAVCTSGVKGVLHSIPNLLHKQRRRQQQDESGKGGAPMLGLEIPVGEVYAFDEGPLIQQRKITPLLPSSAARFASESEGLTGIDSNVTMQYSTGSAQYSHSSFFAPVLSNIWEAPGSHATHIAWAQNAPVTHSQPQRPPNVRLRSFLDSAYGGSLSVPRSPQDYSSVVDTPTMPFHLGSMMHRQEEKVNNARFFADLDHAFDL